MKKVRRYQKNYVNYRIDEALGHWPETHVGFWLHCASVGEVLAAKALLKSWIVTHPEQKILVTTVTPTGAEQVVKQFGDAVIHRYLPMDYPAYVNKALDKLSCSKMAIIETELWPNLLKRLKEENIPTCVINARMSEKSANNYKRFSSFSNQLFSLPDLFLAHHPSDAARFKELGASNVEVSGNIKFDITPTNDVLECHWRKTIGKERFVWVGASTHEGEDEILLSVHKKIKEQFPTALLILVPRHPERFEAVAELAKQRFDSVEMRSRNAIEHWCEVDVLIGDSMGELMHYYQTSDAAFVGGSLIERGGHNPIEPAVLGKPILIGPHTFNFLEISQSLVEEGGAIRVSSTESLVDALLSLNKRDKCIDVGRRALAYAEKNQGALERTLDALNRM
ncbi:3-deoxy-D-manno-octulosonic acid transferase [Marinomonas balearica]|nr:3-deoxy-D-manno-octulosonic acid transferase [Marinomonas balearica]